MATPRQHWRGELDALLRDVTNAEEQYLNKRDWRTEEEDFQFERAIINISVVLRKLIDLRFCRKDLRGISLNCAVAQSKHGEKFRAYDLGDYEHLAAKNYYETEQSQSESIDVRKLCSKLIHITHIISMENYENRVLAIGILSPEDHDKQIMAVSLTEFKDFVRQLRDDEFDDMQVSVTKYSFDGQTKTVRRVR